MKHFDKKLLAERWAPETSKNSIDFRYFFAQKYCEHRTVLDAGCGVGYGAKLLTSTAKVVFAVDYSKEAVKYASDVYMHPKLSFLTMNVTNLGFKENSFDRVVSVEVFEHIHKYNVLLSEIKRVLKDTGLFIMTTPNKVFENKDKNGLNFTVPAHINLVNSSKLKKILDKHFSSVKIWGVRSNQNWLYTFIRLVDFLNIRLFLKENNRRTLKKIPLFSSSHSHKILPSISKNGLQTTKNEIEMKLVHPWNTHTFHCFIAVCEK